MNFFELCKNHIWPNIETSEQKSTVFVTRFESSDDGIKSTTSKIADVDGVLIEEVLSETEQEQVKLHGDVIIEEVREEGESQFSLKYFRSNQIEMCFNAELQQSIAY